MNSDLLPLAMNGETQRPLRPLKSRDVFKLVAGDQSWRLLRKLVGLLGWRERRLFRDEEEDNRRFNDPRFCGWKVLLNEDEPNRREIMGILAPLSELRQASVQEPLILPRLEPSEWQEWIETHLSPNEEGLRPFLLLVGSPQRIPFAFQALVSSQVRAGRLDFDDLQDLERYVAKVVACERGEGPLVERRFLCFAPHDGRDRATDVTCGHLARSVLERARRRLGLHVDELLEDQALAPRFKEAVQRRPAVVFAAGHGSVFPFAEPHIQEKYNGAVVCHRNGGSVPFVERSFSANDVNPGEEWLHGSVFFQFGCFGIGTPACSGYTHLRQAHRSLAPRDFTAALPRRLLALEKGPVGYIGHFDLAWVTSISARDETLNANRSRPFSRLLMSLLSGSRMGVALEELHALANRHAANIAQRLDGQWHDGQEISVRTLEALTDAFLLFKDAQNYMLLGDPAAFVRVPLDKNHLDVFEADPPVFRGD
ncbi:MAG TPA: hypothetical protein VLV83_11535 [Acidobacteriota bacterium]|nr:hypothetical protein [Acidobacteriota bacterium]